MSSRRRARRPFLAVAAALLLLPLTSCATGSASDSQASPALPGVAADVADSAGGIELTVPETEEMVRESSVASSGNIAITVGDPAIAAEEVATIARDLGGSVASQTVEAATEWATASANVLVRVPSDSFDEAFTRLGGVGDVISQSRSAEDVTTQHVDLQARVAALQSSVDRLTELMAGAATTSELLEAESALSERQQELDGLQAQLDALEDRVEEASIWVTLTSKSALPGGPANFWEGLLAGFASIAAAGAGALVILGILIPWLLVVGIVAAIVVLIVRARRRRRSVDAQTVAPAPPEHPQDPPVDPETEETPAPHVR